MKIIILNWYGPYTDKTLEEEKEFGYLITGKKLYDRDANIQYCGITRNTYHGRILTHHKKERVTRNREYWFSEVFYPKRTNRDVLETAEKIIVYFWQPPLNERKTISIPQPTTIINQWFTIEGMPRINQKSIYKELDDVISWDGKYWRTGNLKVWSD